MEKLVYKYSVGGKEYSFEADIKVECYKYVTDIAVNLYHAKADEYGDAGEYGVNLTVGLTGYELKPFEAFIDTNNSTGAESFIKKYKLGECTGDYSHSRYCSYPLYKFNKDRLKELDPEGYARYLETLK